MDAYLQRIANQTALTADHECQLARLARQGDRAARDELITSMLGLVVARARQLGFRGARLMDAVQAGSEGLIWAVDRFDPERGARLSSYAWWWIADAMKTIDREVPVADPVVSVDAGEVEPHRGLHAACRGLDEPEATVLKLRYGDAVTGSPGHTRAETARHMGITIGQVRQLENKAIGHLRGRLAKVGPRAPVERNLRGAGPL